MAKKNKVRLPMWLPYLDTINIHNKTKGELKFKYKGGEVITDLSDVQSIMIYGDFGELDSNIIEQITRKGIPILIHKRNMNHTVYISSGLRANEADILSLQILAKNNLPKQKHITRKILEAKFKTQSWLLDYSYLLLDRTMSVDKMRNIEAQRGKLYWQKYFKELGINTTRRSQGELKSILDAVSKFLFGIILRWINYHHLSPYHGYLHIPTTYPSLVYDLIEPYRAYYEKIVFEEYKQYIDSGDIQTEEQILNIIIAKIKEFNLEKSYTETTRQIVYNQELLHGIVLALQSYLKGECKELMIPLIDTPKGGRPRKVNYRMYGRHAGITNTFKELK